MHLAQRLGWGYIPHPRHPLLFMLLLFNTTRRALFMDEYCEFEKVSS